MNKSFHHKREGIFEREE